MNIQELAKIGDDPVGKLLDLFRYPSSEAPQEERNIWVAKLLVVALFAAGLGIAGWVAIAAQ